MKGNVEFTFGELAAMVPEKPSVQPEPMEYTGPPAKNGRPTPNTPEERAHARAVWGWAYHENLDRFARDMAIAKMNHMLGRLLDY